MPENEHVRDAFRQVLEEQPDICAGKIIGSWFFEPPNIFDANARKRPKPGVVMALSYIALMAAVCVAFNFT